MVVRLSKINFLTLQHKIGNRGGIGVHIIPKSRAFSSLGLDVMDGGVPPSPTSPHANPTTSRLQPSGKVQFLYTPFYVCGCAVFCRVYLYKVTYFYVFGLVVTTTHV